MKKRCNAVSINSMITLIVLWTVTINVSQQCHSFGIITNKRVSRYESRKLQASASEKQEQSGNKKVMSYTRDNIVQQAQTYDSIRRASEGSLENVCNDVYVHDADTDLFWYVGKLARCSTVSIQLVIARQYSFIEEHACRLRPIELGRKVGELEIWTAPIDSELKVANGEFDLQKMERHIIGDDVVSPLEAGLYCEYVTNKGDGFSIKRDTKN